MGCDIHLHVEVKIEGRWEHLNAPSVPRHYRLFAHMAGVRNYIDHDPITPIAEPRGLPSDTTAITQFDYKRWEGDAHSASHLNAVEILDLKKRMSEEFSRWDEANALGCYLFDNDLSGFVEYPEDNPVGLEDVRLVFWFDN